MIQKFDDFINEALIEEARSNKSPKTGIINKNKSTLELNQKMAQGNIHPKDTVNAIKELLINGFIIKYSSIYDWYQVSNWAGAKFEEMRNYKREHYPRIPRCFYPADDPLPLWTNLIIDDNSKFDEAWEQLKNEGYKMDYNDLHYDGWKEYFIKK